MQALAGSHVRTGNPPLLPGEDLKSNSRDMPGGGGMLKFRIDRYITANYIFKRLPIIGS